MSYGWLEVALEDLLWNDILEELENNAACGCSSSRVRDLTPGRLASPLKTFAPSLLPSTSMSRNTRGLLFVAAIVCNEVTGRGLTVVHT